MAEEILFNSGLCDTFTEINDSILKAGIITDQQHTANFDKIELTRKTRKQETGTITTKQEGTEL